MAMSPFRFLPCHTIFPLLLLCLLGIYGCGLEKGSIFFPDRRITTLPSDVGLTFEDLYLTTGDGVRINAWFIPHRGSSVSLLWLHGNAGNISNRVESVLLFHNNLKVNILILDYRRYGNSEGRISEDGTYLDAVAGYDYLAGRYDVDPRKIVIYGKSLGAAIAVEAAIRRQAYGLILESPFTSIRDMAGAPISWLPLNSLLSIRYDSISKMKHIDEPLLVLHGNLDRVVPHKQGRRIFDAAPGPKSFHTIPGANHNDTIQVGGRSYFDAIRKFIEGLP